MHTPPPGFEPSFVRPPAAPPPRRGAGLTVLLVLLFLYNTVILVVSVLAASKLPRATAALTELEVDPARLRRWLLFSAAFAVARLVCLGAIWAWKSWGVAVYLGLAALGIVVAMKTGEQMSALSGLIGMTLLGFGVLRRWGNFR
jgi:hypothetical protein